MRQILVIEDEPQLQALIKGFLTNSGFNVTVANNGEQGVVLANQLKPDLILTDIKMSGINGFEVMGQIRQNPDLANIPFIFITGYPESNNYRDSMNLGADDFLTKPFSQDALLGSVNARIQKLISIERMTEAKLEALRKSIATSLPHELKTPLSVIIGLVDLLIDSYPNIDQTELLDCLTDMKSSSDRINSLVSNYIEYARLTLDPNILTKEASLGQKTEMYQDWLQDLASLIATKYDRLADLQVDEIEPARIVIKESRLIKILSELIDNAFKFSKPGTPVVIDTWSEIESNQITIQISDRGRGFSADEIKRIGAYTQFGRKTYEQQGGGMGLELAKYFTESFNGRLSIDSRIDEYTAVSVRLPLA